MRGTAKSGTDSRHVLALDGVRGLAIIVVMLHHFTVLPAGGAAAGWILRLAEFGAHGVDLFFVLSGFLITSQLLGPQLDTARIGRFYTRRALRIVPLYYAILIVVFLILPMALRETGFTQKLATQTNFGGNWPWYALFASNFRNALDGRFTNPALDVSWSLAIEMQFYIVWPWVIRMCSRRALKHMIWAVILASPCLRTVAWCMDATWIQILVLPFLRADILMWGALLAIWMDESRSGEAMAAGALDRVRSSLPLIAPVILLILLAGGWDRQNAFTSTLGYSLIGLAAAGICSRVLTMPPGDWLRRFFESRGLVFISCYAYGLYLVHLPIRAVLRDVVFRPVDFSAWPPAPFAGQFVFYAFAGLASFLPAAACWHFVENRFIQWGHRITSSSRVRAGDKTPSASADLR